MNRPGVYVGPVFLRQAFTAGIFTVTVRVVMRVNMRVMAMIPHASLKRRGEKAW
ncbi:hypothetical protein [Mariprofundus ferrooxydans]|uniref:hypothetical protein n=1 Tax=Mariprofundus ferrooxydans TaxID=314344 RepID=UPI00030C3504|nr:hypothetical protein [Mariprofundus ferrooxydans]